MRLIVICLAGVLVLGACGESDDAPADTAPGEIAAVTSTVPDVADVEIATIHERVEYYGACGNETVTVDGVTYYPLLREDLDDLAVDRYPLVGGLLTLVGSLSAPMVAPPGPGDDVGDMIVYVNGIARFESDSGWVIWLTDQEQVYGWEC